MKFVKKIASGVYLLLLFSLVILALSTIFSLIQVPGGLRVFVVQSGSMMPTVKTGSLALTKAQSKYSEGEIVTFRVKPQTKMAENGEVVMHRIVKVTNEDKAITYTTKGDANQGNDPDPVTENQVLGKVAFTLPYAGYGVAFARTLPGFLFLIVLPGAILVGMEVLSIKQEVARMLASKKSSKSKSGKVKVVKHLAIILGTLWLSSFAVVGSKALFSDEEISIGAGISTGKWDFGEPQLVCEFKGDKNMFHFSFFNHGQQFNSFSYQLVYETNGITQSAIGADLELRESCEQDIFLGTCSGDVCVPDGELDNLNFEVSLDGQKRMGCRWVWQENQWHEF